MTRVIESFGADLSLKTTVADGLRYNTADDVTVYVTRPDYPPLSKKETSARLKFTDGDGELLVIVKLDAVGLDALADAVFHTQRSLREGE